MVNWSLWQRGTVEREISSIVPILAQWQATTHPAEVRLRAYVAKLVEDLSPLPTQSPLFLHLDVDVQEEKRLLQHHDLENYLTPLFGRRWLPADRFVLVSARKYVGGGSRVLCGVARKLLDGDDPMWTHFSHEAGPGSGSTQWKMNLRSALANANKTILAPGPAKVRIVWRCSGRRNWSNLWKATGDAMGPVLGCFDVRNQFNTHDDRITELELQLNRDDSLRNDIVVGMWWASAVTG